MGDFNAVSAKMSKMTSEFLTDRDYISMSRFQTVSEIITYLKENTKLSSYFDGYEDSYEAERKLDLYKLDLLTKLRHYYKGNYLYFVNAAISEFEIDDIKRVLRYLKTKDGRRSLKDRLIVLNSDNLIEENDTIKTFVEKLKGTKYYKVLRQYVDDAEDVVLFYMEMNLDKLYYQQLVEISNTFSKAEKQKVDEVLGVKIDLLNITWIYRGIKYYGLMPEELLNLAVIGGKVFNFGRLREMVYMDIEKEFVPYILNSHYEFLFQGESQDIYLDRRSSRFLYYTCREVFKRDFFDFSKFAAFMYILDFEVKDIRGIMEATRFNLSPGETLNYLVRSYKGSELTWL